MAKRSNAATPRWEEDKQRWQLQVYKNGKRKSFTSSKPGKAGHLEVRRKYNHWLTYDEALTDPRLRDVWPEYLEDVVQRKGKSSKTYLDAESVGRTRFLPAYGAMLVSMITEQHWQRLLNEAKPLSGKGELSKKTVMNIRGQITLFCKYLKKAGYIDWRPDSLEIPDKFEYRQDKNILQKEEIAYMLKDETTSVYIMACQLMLVYGFRPGEVYGLQWTDVGNSKITINRSVNNRGQITPGKNKNARRVEFLISYAKDLFERARRLQVKENRISPWIFANKNGNPIYGANAVHALHEYCAKNKLTDVSPYRLRHTFASLAKNSLTEAQLKLTLGHSESMDTGIYTHELEQDHIDTGKVLNKMFADLLG